MSIANFYYQIRMFLNHINNRKSPNFIQNQESQPFELRTPIMGKKDTVLKVIKKKWWRQKFTLFAQKATNKDQWTGKLSLIWYIIKASWSTTFDFEKNKRETS